jgi:hypothetical protein
MTSARSRQGRRLAPLFGAAAVLLFLFALLAPGRARAGKNDLQLLNLCPTGPVMLGGVAQQECTWVMRDPSTGTITGGVRPDEAGQSRYRSLMSELGVVVAPRLMTPADTLGYAGFQFSAELGVTKINPERKITGPDGMPIAYWDGIAGVNADNRSAVRPDAYLTTVGAFVRKGLWLPLPAFEFGAGALKILDSNMYAVQGYAKFALQEGFHGWVLPSFAVRGSVSQLLGTDQVDLTVWGIDVLASKAFSIGGTARIEPYLGWNILFIDARSGVIDATPGCDARAVEVAQPGDPAPTSHCDPGQNGTPNDLLANFSFPDQDIITRQRFFAGFKLKLYVMFLTAELDISPAGTSHDSKQPEGASDRSGAQETYSLSAGFDF